MKLCATSSELAANQEAARATWPLPESALTYFPDARSNVSDRDLVAAAAPTGGGVGVVQDDREGRPEDHPEDHGHIPVLLERCVQLLTPALTRKHDDGTDAVLVDATLGAGGHSERFLTDLPGLRLIGLDRDPNALAIAGARLAGFGDRVQLVRTRYDGIAWALTESGHPHIDGVLFDLGVSSMQLDLAERGFSYSVDAPLDMRMDPDARLTAAEIVNTYDAREIARVLRDFGEERFAGRIADKIVRRRARQPFTTTGELVELLYEAIPAPARRTGGHPAKRTFQALRIAVNSELDSLRAALPAALAALVDGGRIVVMAYQSLEDRIVKHAFSTATASRTTRASPILPCCRRWAWSAWKCWPTAPRPFTVRTPSRAWST